MPETPDERISRVMADPAAITRALAEAARQAILSHKRSGDPIVVWRDGVVVWIPADQIECPELPEPTS